MASKDNTLVAIHDVSKRYNRFEASFVLRGVSLSIPEGHRVLITGPSGGGKTTLLNLVGGIDRPTEGHIRIAGHDIARLREGPRARWRASTIGFVFQHHFLPRGLRAWEAVALPLLWHDATFNRFTARERAELVLEEAGLGDHLAARVEHLSGGQRQRVALARALAPNPPLILADEPTSNLDRDTGRAIASLLAQWSAENGTTTLLVTHEGDRALWDADEEYRLEHGHLDQVA